MDKYVILKQFFGHDEFRPGQGELIDAILAGRDVLGVMPTGGGKSMCYQVPAQMLPGMTLVVSPLISLMKDQVAALENAGVSAAYLSSDMTVEQRHTVYARVRAGAYQLLYVAPERLESEGFNAMMQTQEVSLVAVDEAHCISQWGQDFRPSYLRIPDFVEGLPRRPVVAAFTATATTEVRQDILRLLRLRHPVCHVTGFDRPNLYFDTDGSKDKMSALLGLLRKYRGKSGIVYCATRVSAEKICQTLCDEGIPAVCYHAGMDAAARRASQEDFQFDRKQVIVATNAFGLGIDKSNVSFVINYNMPRSLEAYYQEAGRAGRDGEPADCILLHSAGDIETAKFMIQNSGNEALDEETQERIRQLDYQRLQQMVGYCRTTKCLRGYILDYFGQKHTASCGNCGNCRGNYQLKDITVQAQMVLSCVMRVKEHIGYYVGRTLLVQALRGSKDQRLLSLGLEQISTYGLMKQVPAEQVRAYIDFLEEEGYLRTDPLHYTIAPTRAASEVLFGGKKLSMSVRMDLQEQQLKKAEKAKKAARRKKEPVEVSREAEDLFAALKETRTQVAREERVPVYIIFSNATLTDMAEKMPRNMEELLTVSGVGQAKADRYGAQFLKTIEDYRKVLS